MHIAFSAGPICECSSLEQKMKPSNWNNPYSTSVALDPSFMSVLSLALPGNRGLLGTELAQHSEGIENARGVMCHRPSSLCFSVPREMFINYVFRRKLTLLIFNTSTEVCTAKSFKMSSVEWDAFLKRICE